MEYRSPQTLAITSSLSDARRFVRNFSGVPNISASGLRNHLTAVRLGYWFTLDNQDQNPDNYSWFDVLGWIQLSHKAHGNQVAMSLNGIDVWLFMALFGMVSMFTLPATAITVPAGGQATLCVELTLPWAPGLYGDAMEGVDPLDGCADLSMFGNSGELISEFSPVFNAITTTIVDFYHVQEIDVAALTDLYVFQPLEVRQVNTTENPALLTGSYRKWLAAYVRGDQLASVPALLAQNINLRVDGRPVYENVITACLINWLLKQGGDLRGLMPIWANVQALNTGLALVPPAPAPYDIPPVMPIVPLWTRGTSRGRNQLGPVGQSFEVLGAVNAFNKPPIKYLQFSAVARDRGMFATQIQRAGLDPAVYNESTAYVGGRKYIETHLSADASVGLGCRWPNVARG